MNTDERIRYLTSALENNHLCKSLQLYEEVGSTNDLLKKQAEAGAEEGCIVIADLQTHGRGRMGKDWLSMAGKGLYMSVLLRPGWPASDSMLTGIMTGVAVAKAFDQVGLSNVTLKWPNDVLVNNKKIAGILTETRIGGNFVDFIVIGIGVNLLYDEHELRLTVEQPATSCRMEGVNISCDDAAIKLLESLDEYYDLFQKGERNVFLDEWSARTVVAGK